MLENPVGKGLWLPAFGSLLNMYIGPEKWGNFNRNVHLSFPLGLAGHNEWGLLGCALNLALKVAS